MEILTFMVLVLLKIGNVGPYEYFCISDITAPGISECYKYSPCGFLGIKLNKQTKLTQFRNLMLKPTSFDSTSLLPHLNLLNSLTHSTLLTSTSTSPSLVSPTNTNLQTPINAIKVSQANPTCQNPLFPPKISSEEEVIQKSYKLVGKTERLPRVYISEVK